MSAVVAGSNSKGEKSKKFQSLNINTIYQGASTKPPSKAATHKHGLQSLGKVPTARRAPANLPSLKAENFGNETNVSLVPASGTGWGGPQPGQSGVQPLAHSTTAINKEADLNAKPSEASSDYLNNTEHSSKSWASTSYASQRTAAIFVQEFPSLESSANDQDKKNSQQGYNQSPGNQNQSDGKSSDKYGPGPNLRPASFGQWGFGGKQQSNSNSSSNNIQATSNNNHPNSNDSQSSENVSLGETLSLRSSALPLSSQSPGLRQLATVSNTLKFDVSPNSPFQYFPGPVIPRKQPSQGVPLPAEGRGKHPKSVSRSGRDGPLFQAPIIDRDKLKRLDDIECNDDDWAKSDETFDYNKKIDSADEDEENDSEEDLNRGRGIRSNWADQLSLPQKENRFDYQSTQPIPVRKISGDIPFFDDEEHRRAKKNEEVLQSIERAKKRREEEEQKYKSLEYSPTREANTNSDGFLSLNHRQQNDQNLRRGYRQQSCSSNSSREDSGPGLNKQYHSSGKYENQDYEDRKHDPSSGFGSRKSGPSSSVPPRFKRHGGELQQFKRGYQGKGAFEDEFRGQQQQPPQWDRRSSESDPDRLRESANDSRPANEGESADSKFLPLSTSNSKDNFDTNSSYSASSSMDKVGPSASNQSGSSHQMQLQSQATQISGERQRNSYEDRRSVETDPGKGGGEQSNFSKRSNDHQGRKRDADFQQQQQQQNYNRQHKDEYEYNSMKRNGGRGGSKGEEHNDGYRDYRGRGRGAAQASSRGKPYGGQQGPSTSRGQGPKKIILPPRANRDGIQTQGRSEKRTSDNEDEPVVADHSSHTSKSTQQTSVSSNVVPESLEKAVQKAESGEASRQALGVEILKPSQKDREGTPSSGSGCADQQSPKVSDSINDPNHQGWFAPRGQPSRRGRGGLSGSGVGASRAFGGNKNEVSDGFQHPQSVNPPMSGNESKHSAEEWDSTSDNLNDKKRDKKDFDNKRQGSRKKENGSEEYTEFNRQQGNRQIHHSGKDLKDKRPQQLPQQLQTQQQPSQQQPQSNAVPQQQQQQQQQQQGKQPVYERRQNKLPPRLAKQKEQNRMKYGRDSWGQEGSAPGQQPGSYQWGDQLSSDQSSGIDFNSHDQRQHGFRGQDGPNSLMSIVPGDGLHHTDHGPNDTRQGTVQTIIFENTNFKGAADKMFKDGALHMPPPIGFGGQQQTHKAEDSVDLKLDFTFESSDMPPHLAVDDKTLVGRHQGQNQVSADDLNMKIASVKKVWETARESTTGSVQDIVSKPTFGPQSFVTDDKFGPSSNDMLVEDPSGGVAHSVPYDKTDMSKVRPQMMQQPPLQAHHHQPQIDVGRSLSNVASNVALGRLIGSSGLQTLHSSPSMLSQPPSLYTSFQIDPSRGVSNQLYPAYPSVMLPNSGISGTADLFGPPPQPPPTSSQFRMPTGGSGHFGQSGQSASNNVLLSQSHISSAIHAMKTSNQIGPIGTKGGNAGTVPYQQPGLTGLQTAATSPLMIPYDSPSAISFLANSIQRSPAGQNPFFQTSRPPMAFNLQGFPNAGSLQQQQQQQQQQQLNSQLRSQNMYMKQDPSSKQGRGDNSMSSQMGGSVGLQAHLGQGGSSVGIGKVANSLNALNIRGPPQMNPGLVTGMPPQNPTGPTYSPTPIQRPQGKSGDEPSDLPVDKKLSDE